nr:hypothetical protein [Actinomycetales bacterium]
MRLLLIIGPPAVGKMAVGREIAARSGFRLFHNHHTIEPLSEVFGFGTEPFNVLNLEFRRRIIEESAKYGVDLVFTLVWDLGDPADTRYVETLIAPVTEAGGEVRILELAADLETRLARNRGESRLAAKPSKRDLAWSDENVRAMEVHRMNTDPGGATSTPADGLLARHPHLRLDTTYLAVAEAAEEALGWLDRLSDQ